VKTAVKCCPHCGQKGKGYRRGPVGYVEWMEWAEKLGRTHEQEECPGCGRLTVWRKKENAA
jgi:predicted RNA-binding Zn-ribbon protein involved in translation (DUF1610 family)